MADIARQSDLGRLGRSRPFILLYFRPWSDSPPKVRKTPKLETNHSIPGLETCLVLLSRFRCSGTAPTRGCRPAFLTGGGVLSPARHGNTHTPPTAVRVVCGKMYELFVQDLFRKVIYCLSEYMLDIG